jgi:hypothetical protein
MSVLKEVLNSGGASRAVMATLATAVKASDLMLETIAAQAAISSN